MHTDQRNYSPKGHRGAFTLIELLTVIAIISILSSILLPVFATARERGRQAHCINNLNQIALSVLMYVNDSDETYPMASEGKHCNASTIGDPHAGCDPNLKTIPEILAPYMASNATWKCPSAANRISSDYDYGYAEYLGWKPLKNGNSANPHAAGGNGTGNSGNSNGNIAVTNEGTPFTSKLSDNVSPSTLVMACDIIDAVIGSAQVTSPLTDPSTWSECNSSTTSCPSDLGVMMPPGYAIKGLKNNWPNEMSTDSVWPSPRHLGRCMVVYTDGHVKSENVAQMAAHDFSGDPQCAFCNGL